MVNHLFNIQYGGVWDSRFFKDFHKFRYGVPCRPFHKDRFQFRKVVFHSEIGGEDIGIIDQFGFAHGPAEVFPELLTRRGDDNIAVRAFIHVKG